MRKLKYILFFVMLIFGLNSCLTTMVGWGICEQYGCDSYSYKETKEKDIDGIVVFAKKYPSQVTSYFESIKKSKLIKTEIGEKEKFYINLPQNFILKRFGKTNYYLYDKEKNIGFFEIEYSEVEKNFEGTYTFSGKKYKLVSVDNKIFEFNDGVRYILKLKKISKNYYAIAEYNKDMPKEILDIYTYLIENL